MGFKFIYIVNIYHSKLFTDKKLASSTGVIVKAIVIDEVKPGATGPDNLLVLLLKKCKVALSMAIHIIWKHSMSNGAVKDYYKKSYIS